jgi:signal transduction histidine kinase/CheY-like chemotaxis protein
VKHPLLEVDLTKERDISVARQRARHISGLLGFDAQDQARIATTVSELARNALRYASGGRIEFALEAEPARDPILRIVLSDDGPGITDLESAMSGTTSSGEPKLGLVTAKRTMDQFEVGSNNGRGAVVKLGRIVPRRAQALSDTRITAIKRDLAANRTDDASVEAQQQNRELMRVMEELRVRQEELERLNAELEDTNRGVLALYAELDERATHLRLADETKTRFLSSISHEFRTPLNSILALSKILLHRLDGELSAEQDKQVRYIAQAAEQLSTLVDDLLDLRKVESGKIQLRMEPFTVSDLFGALRGMFKPLAVNDDVALIFDEPADLPQLHTDQGKVAQILRNLVSNALKFTSRGSVRLSAKLTDDRKMIVFSVADTGVGIASENHRRIFEEFIQVENPLQAAVKGTGLGLPLSQRLAGLLGGSIEIRSKLGEGSVFSLAIALRLDAAPAGVVSDASPTSMRAAVDRVLIIDDNEVERYALRQFLSAARYEVIEATGGYDGLRLARQSHPDFIFLDLLMPDVHGTEVLKLLKAIEETRGIPVVIFTSQRMDEIEHEKIAAASAVLTKNDLSRESVAEVLRRIEVQAS